MQINEDEIFRSSSQYRLWTFTPEKLAALRAETNRFAATQVREAIKRHRRKTANGTNGSAAPQNGNSVQANVDSKEDHDGPAVECLSVDEEYKLVGYYLGTCRQMGKKMDLPDHVVVRFNVLMLRAYRNCCGYHANKSLRPPLYSSSTASISTKAP